MVKRKTFRARSFLTSNDQGFSTNKKNSNQKNGPIRKLRAPNVFLSQRWMLPVDRQVGVGRAAHIERSSVIVAAMRMAIPTAVVGMPSGN